MWKKKLTLRSYQLFYCKLRRVCVCVCVLCVLPTDDTISESKRQNGTSEAKRKSSARQFDLRLPSSCAPQSAVRFQLCFQASSQRHLAPRPTHSSRWHLWPHPATPGHPRQPRNRRGRNHQHPSRIRNEMEWNEFPRQKPTMWHAPISESETRPNRRPISIHRHPRVPLTSLPASA